MECGEGISRLVRQFGGKVHLTKTREYTEAKPMKHSLFFFLNL